MLVIMATLIIEVMAATASKVASMAELATGLEAVIECWMRPRVLPQVQHSFIADRISFSSQNKVFR